jgi:hypothetical protein
MSTADIKQRLDDANRTGEEVRFTEGESIPAEWIRDLALQSGHHKGLMVRGANIVGRLDFDDCTIARPIRISHCSVVDGVGLHRVKG